MASFYAFPVIFIDTVQLSKKGTLIKRAGARGPRTPWTPPLIGPCVDDTHAQRQRFTSYNYRVFQLRLLTQEVSVELAQTSSRSLRQSATPDVRGSTGHVTCHSRQNTTDGQLTVAVPGRPSNTKHGGTAKSTGFRTVVTQVNGFCLNTSDVDVTSAIELFVRHSRVYRLARCLDVIILVTHRTPAAASCAIYRLIDY